MAIAINPLEVTKKITAFIRESFRNAGFTNAVVALSGGVDSATSFLLSTQALGADHVYPVLLPYGALNTQGVLDAMNIINETKIPINHITRVDIRPIVDAVFSKEAGVDNVRRGNAMARARMIVLFDQAKKRIALVVGTENRTEHLLGYYTRFGDEASDIEPLRNLYKTRVYDLAKHLGVPEQILSKKPTAGLWEGQTDEGEFGFTYKDADEILLRYFDEKKSIDQIVKEGFDTQIVVNVIGFAKKNDFKHHLPFIPQDNVEKG